MSRGRLDERVVAAGLAETRSRARALIMAGRVLVDDVPVDKAGAQVSDGASLRLRGGGAGRFVSRGGDKLAGALLDLEVDPAGLACLDVGASTGGFTDCLLQAGARSVLAVDVGHGQLHERLRQDPRVTVRERTNARYLTAADLPGRVDLVVADVSFISLRLILPAIAVSAPGAELLAMVKPQFELSPAQVGKGGVVRDDALRDAAVESVRGCAEELAYALVGRADSRLTGPKGNREVFIRLVPSRERAT